MVDLLKPLGASFPVQSVAYTGTAGSTAGWPAGPQGVVIWSSTDAYVVVGEGVTATTTNAVPIPANTAIPFAVPAGSGGLWRVSAIQSAYGGTVYAFPINAA